MKSVIPPGDRNQIKIAGKEQGFLGLAIHYTQTPCGKPVMETAWEPTPEQLQKLLQGASINISILGVPPINPMMVDVNEPPSMLG